MAKSSGRAPALDCASLSSVALLGVPNGAPALLTVLRLARSSLVTLDPKISP